MTPRRAIFVGGPLHNQNTLVVNAPTHEMIEHFEYSTKIGDLDKIVDVRHTYEAQLDPMTGQYIVYRDCYIFLYKSASVELRERPYAPR